MTLERWQAECVDRLVSTKTASLVQVISYDYDRKESGKDNGERTLFRIYSRSLARPRQAQTLKVDTFISKIGTSTPDRVVEDADSSNLDFGDRTRKMADKLRGQDLDFILHFGSRPVPEEILKIPQYGIWIFRNYDGTRYHGRPDCFWQVFNGDYVTGAVLERLGDQENTGRVLWEGHFKTIRESYPRNLDQVLRACTSWPIQACRKIQNNDALIEDEETKNILDQKGYHAPGNTQVVQLALKTLKRRIVSLYRLLFRYTSWNVGIVESPITSFLDPSFKPTKIHWLPQPRNGHIQADPFGTPNDHGLTVLYERMDYLHRKGVICAVDVKKDDDGLHLGKSRLAIELPVHMSYPYILTQDGQTYCVPETNQAREVPIYKATSLPDKWTKTGTILKDIRAIDTTIFRHEGRWWAMLTDRERGGDANLYLWYSEDLSGPWQPHPLNPVKTDVRSARPAGTPFVQNGQLYRPAMDCSMTGGGRVIINRVQRLTVDEFQEEPATILEPYRDSPYRVGLHTLSSVGEFTLIDGKRFRFYPSGLLSNLLKALKRLSNEVT